MSGVDTSGWEGYVSRYLVQAQEGTLETVLQAAHEIRNEAINRSPVNTGYLRAGWRPPDYQRFGDRAFITVENSVPYVRAVEFGTRPHTIRVRTKKVLANKKTGQVFGIQVSHPGTRPRPMLRPAIDLVLPVLRRKLGG